ncbi:hypothetical protein ACHAPT_009699 [Fusarium lateritium]
MPQQGYTLSEVWTNEIINDDPSVPEKSFRLANRTLAAFVVLYKRVDGQLAPIYFSAMGPLPQGNEDLIHTNKVAVKQVGMTGKTDVTLQYSGPEGWTQL